ncbi:MAG: hypothetical protein ACYCZX_20265 [Rhodospirillaceae bacterium]
MNIPAIRTNSRTLPADPFHMDVEPMSRADAFSEIDPPSRAYRAYSDNDPHSPIEATISTLSYPQRIAVLISRAPSPPPLRRVPQEVRQPMSEETRAMLLYVHTAHATYGGPNATQPH